MSNVIKTTRLDQIREKIAQHLKNKASIGYLQHQNCQIELELVEELVQNGDYEVLDINWSRLNHFLKRERGDSK